MSKDKQEFLHIVRIGNQDCRGDTATPYAIAKVKGIGIRLGKLVCKKAGIPLNLRLGYLSEDEIAKLDELVSDLKKTGLPAYYFNRPKDLETGNDRHLISQDLIVETRDDINRMKKTRSNRGIRHSLGLKVRGQHTKTTGRGGHSVGVAKTAASKPAA